MVNDIAMTALEHGVFNFVELSMPPSLAASVYTANLFTAKIAGFHCVQIPTALSLHFLQSLNACSGSLQFDQKCSFLTAIFTKFHLHSANSFTMYFLQNLTAF